MVSGILLHALSWSQQNVLSEANGFHAKENSARSIKDAQIESREVYTLSTSQVPDRPFHNFTKQPA